MVQYESMPEFSSVFDLALEVFGQQIADQLKKLEPESDPQKKIATRVFAAAVVSRKFSTKLINNPIAAIEEGYEHERFDLNPLEKDLFYKSSLQAESLTDLANNYIKLSAEAKK